MKKLLFLFLITNSSLLIVNAQSQFQLTIGGTDEDRAYSIIQTTDGGYALSGITLSYGVGLYDSYIIRLNALGVLQWTKTIGIGGSLTSAYSIIQTTDGGFAVAGYQTGGICITKLEASGTFQWSCVSQWSGDKAYSIVQTTDGGYAVAGITALGAAGQGGNMCIIKLNPSGVNQWSRAVGGPQSEFGYSIIQTTDGGYAVAGYTESFGAGGYDLYIVKLNSSGTLQWNITVGGTGDEYGFSIIQTTDGGYAVAGYTDSFGAGGYDLYIVKLNSSGTLQWTRTVGDSQSDYGYSIIQTADGGFVIAGQTDSFGENGDMYFVKLDASGVLQWTRTADVGYLDEAQSIIKTTDGGYVAAGQTEGLGMGDYDMFIVKFDANWNNCGTTSLPVSTSGTGGTTTTPATTAIAIILQISSATQDISSGGAIKTSCGIGIQPISNEIPASFSLSQNYPNPFNPNTKIRFDVPKSEFITMKIFDALGREIETLVNEKLVPGTYEVDWNGSNYPSGVYFYRLTAGDFTETKKMILIK